MPAIVVTLPAGLIMRIRPVAFSVVYTLPRQSMAIPQGPHSVAFAPWPSVDWQLSPVYPNPASVDMTPAGVILPMVLAPGSVK